MLATLKELANRLRALVRGGDLDRDFAQELATHLEMLTEDNIRKGLSPIEARRQAALRLGGASSLQSRHRDVRGFRFLEDLLAEEILKGTLHDNEPIKVTVENSKLVFQQNVSPAGGALPVS